MIKKILRPSIMIILILALCGLVPSFDFLQEKAEASYNGTITFNNDGGYSIESNTSLYPNTTVEYVLLMSNNLLAGSQTPGNITTIADQRLNFSGIDNTYGANFRLRDDYPFNIASMTVLNSSLSAADFTIIGYLNNVYVNSVVQNISVGASVSISLNFTNINKIVIKSTLPTSENTFSIDDLAITFYQTIANANITYNGVTIPDGDTTPSLTEGTDFGSVSVSGGQVYRFCTLQNTGTEQLSITSLGLYGYDSFTATGPSWTIAASGSSTVMLRFNPNSVGPKFGGISISTATGKYSFMMSGLGIDAPSATVGAATSVTKGEATLYGTVNANYDNTTVTFEYGTTTSYGQTAAYGSMVTGGSDMSATCSLTDLDPNTTYHYRVKAVNTVGTVYSSDATFTTLAVVPTVSDAGVTDLTARGCTLQAMVNAFNANTDVSFEYGLTASYGDTTAASESPVTGLLETSVTKTITGLLPNTTYHYRAAAVNVAGTVSSSDMSFTTEKSPPTAATSSASDVTPVGATLHATVNACNENTTVSFEYGLTTSYSETTAVAEGTILGSSDMPVIGVISGLTSNTIYHYRVKAINPTGITYGDDATFTTPLKSGKVLTSDTTINDVDNDIEITFTPDLSFETNITGVTFNGTPLTSITDFDITSGKLTLKPSGGNVLLQTPATADVVITASGYGDSVASQTIMPGAVKSFTIINQPEPSLNNEEAFTAQPTMTLHDQYGNLCADGISANAVVTAASVAGTGSWTIGGTVSISASAGHVAFTDLTCTSISAGTGMITFYSDTIIMDSDAFTLPENNSSITASASSFDKYSLSTGYNDIDVTLTLNGNTLIGIKNGSIPLVLDIDYNVLGNIYTIKKQYLKSLILGSSELTFDFSLGIDPVLTIAVSNTTPPSSSGGASNNDKTPSAGTIVTSCRADGQTKATLTVDGDYLDIIMEEKGNRAVVTIPVNTDSDVVEVVLNGQMIKDVENKAAILRIDTGAVTYTIPASQIDIDKVSEQLGQQVQLKDIKVSITVSEPSSDIVRIVEDTANKNKYQIIVKPVEFTITCTYGEKTVEVSRFNSYVERLIEIPDGIDPSKISTGVVLNNDGTFSHVPTTIVKIDGKYYAKINSLTNSTYSVIYNPVEFSDVASHWAKEAINNMGSRLIISGLPNNRFDPDAEITRAQFAAIIVRALGLTSDTGESLFSDVKTTEWYSGYIKTAASYGIIEGYNATTFAPNKKITREQTMVMVKRAMSLIGMNTAITDSDTGALLSGYSDGSAISSFAQTGVAICLETGIITGKGNNTIKPKDYITRAEVAVIIERLLKISSLI